MRNNTMTRMLVCGLVVLMTAGFAEAFPYTVQPGDTLISIAEKQLGNGKRWREVAQFNGVHDPSQLSVGRVLLLPDDGPATEEPVRPETAVLPRSVGNAVARTHNPPSGVTSAPIVATANTTGPASTPTTATVAPTPTDTSNGQAGGWSVLQYIGGKLAQHGLIAIVLGAGLLGMMAAWFFSLITPRNLLAVGFAFLVITAAMFFMMT